MDLHSMEDHIKGLLTQHLRQPKHLSCTCNANMKWSTGQSGFARTLRQVIKSTVANMNARQPQQQTSQITVHMNENHKKNKITGFKFQVSQTNCFTFPVSKTNKILYNFSKTHANFSMHRLSSLFPVSHRLKSSRPA